MAFLDNSGDIILDAVLTDIGRQRLADGNFKISRYALGDDEINYSQYDKNNASGSAYYDLEILQTPILQAFTQTNANINYGLLNITNTNIMYMPSLVVNSLRQETQEIKNGIYYVSVNSTTTTRLLSSSIGFTSKQMQDASTATTPALYVEGGLNTSDLAKTQGNKQSYISGLGISNGNYTLSVDSRLINGIMMPTGQGAFSINSDGSNFQIPTQLRDNVSAVNAGNLDNYKNYRLAAVNNALYETSTGTAVTNYSAITGPGDTLTYFKVKILDELKSTVTRSNLYDKYGSVSQNLFGVGDNFDYIDTMVYITGNTTGNSLGIPVRIIRYAG
tara:strand:- start:52 stop:1047 length:996 start_codon:yes stop_codon:yes gene_type:complete